MATQDDIEKHYDVGNDFYEMCLDEKYLGYTCGVWDKATTNEQSQKDKFERLCHYANVKEGSNVLDVGCGWGGVMKFVSEKYPTAHVHGLTLSTKQIDYIDSLKLTSNSVELRAWQNYSPPEHKFDAITCIGCLEHFATYEDSAEGRQRDIYKNFFDWCLSVTTPEAQIGLQTIVMTRMPSNLTELRDSWLVHEVFPGSALSSISDIQAAIVDKYEISKVSRIGLDYVQTLKEWDIKLQSNKDLIIARYSEELYELYHNYFNAASRCFETGYFDLYQVSLKRAEPTRILS